MSRPVVFFGSGEFGVPTLARLAGTEEILAVVTQPDRPAGRGGKPTPTPIAAWVSEHLPGVSLFKPERVADPEVTHRIREIARIGQSTAQTAFVVIAFGQKMPPELLEGAFAINLHASLLPRWRGAAPINTAILAGDRTTGNSVITLAQRMDAGLILGQTSRPIDPQLTAGELHDLLAADGPDLVERVLSEWRSGMLKPRDQDESLVTKAGKLSKDDGWIRFADGADACRRRIHGLTPWPGVTVQFRAEPLKLQRVSAEHDGGMDSTPGTLLDAAGGLVSCGDRSVLRILEVQPAGKKSMRWTDFANGRHVTAGEVLIGRGEGC